MKSSPSWMLALLLAACADASGAPSEPVNVGTPSGSSSGSTHPNDGEAGVNGSNGLQGPKGDKGDPGILGVTEAIANKGTPLPVEAIVTTVGGGILVTVSGSGYRNTAAGPGTLGIDILIDGKVIGSMNSFTNEIGSHKTFATRTIYVPSIPFGDHTVRLEAQLDTKTDGNDYFNVTVLQLH